MNRKTTNYFEGIYYKHQKGEDTLCFIVGTSNSQNFIQVISNHASYHIPFIGTNMFTAKGIKLDIKTNELTLHGSIAYGHLTPIKYPIMGPFQYFPMECTHHITSMYHKLKGTIELNGRVIDFTDGVGYIEGDLGQSFPKTYTWIQCNDFLEKCSIVTSIAHIPFYGCTFQGCICIIQYKHKEYRLATYLGVKVLCNKKNSIILKQGPYRLEIRIIKSKGSKLKAPSQGEMTRTIIETVACPANFKFYIHNKLLFNFTSMNTSYEYEE